MPKTCRPSKPSLPTTSSIPTATATRTARRATCAPVASGQSRYDKVDIENLTIRAYNDDHTAVVNGLVQIDLGPGADGQPVSIRLKYVVVYIKMPEKGWQLVVWHSQKQAA
ncbi:MAG: hypothetical protein WKG07_31780 [Hymenobacter sp.]